MQALQREYGEKRGWRVCGPASIALSRILSERTGVPIERNTNKPHLELTVGIFDPKDDPSRIEEQTYIRFYTGDGNIYYIDPIYGLLMGGKQDLKEAIQVEKYSEDTIDQELIEKHHLYPFDPHHPNLNACKTFTQLRTPADKQMFIDDSVAALNDDRATMAEYVTDSGHIMTTDSAKAESIIKEFSPNWEIDPGIRAQRLMELSQKYSQLATDSLQMRGIPTFNTRQKGLTPSNRSIELKYNDQTPQMETWDLPSKKQQVVTFHNNNQRYIVREETGLEIFENGKRVEITDEHRAKLKESVQQLNDPQIQEFISKYLSLPKSQDNG